MLACTKPHNFLSVNIFLLFCKYHFPELPIILITFLSLPLYKMAGINPHELSGLPPAPPMWDSVYDEMDDILDISNAPPAAEHNFFPSGYTGKGFSEARLAGFAATRPNLSLTDAQMRQNWVNYRTALNRYSARLAAGPGLGPQGSPNMQMAIAYNLKSARIAGDLGPNGVLWNALYYGWTTNVTYLRSVARQVLVVTGSCGFHSFGESASMSEINARDRHERNWGKYAVWVCFLLVVHHRLTKPQIAQALSVARDNRSLQLAMKQLVAGGYIEQHPSYPHGILTMAGGTAPLWRFSALGRQTFFVQTDAAQLDAQMDVAYHARDGTPPPASVSERNNYHDPSYLFDRSIYPDSIAWAGPIGD